MIKDINFTQGGTRISYSKMDQYVSFFLDIVDDMYCCDVRKENGIEIVNYRFKNKHHTWIDGEYLEAETCTDYVTLQLPNGKYQLLGFTFNKAIDALIASVMGYNVGVAIETVGCFHQYLRLIGR